MRRRRAAGSSPLDHAHSSRAAATSAVGAGVHAREVDPLVHRVGALRRPGRTRPSGCRPPGSTRRPSSRSRRRPRPGCPVTASAARATARTTSASGSTLNGGRTSPIRTSASSIPSTSASHSRRKSSDALAGLGAALERKHAARRVARQLLPALDQRGVHGPGAHQLVARRRRRARACSSRQPRQRRRHPGDRVDCPRPAASRAPPGRASRSPPIRSPCAPRTRAAPVGSVTIAASALPALQHRLRADAGVLLVGHGGDDHVARQALARPACLAASMHAATPAFMS